MVFASIAISAGLGRRVVELRGERDRAEKEVTQLEESLRRRERMAAMGSLVAGVAHEVRNPLFGISSTVDALEARVKPEGVAHHLGMLRSQVERLGKLMDDLLEYGRPRALERRPEPLAAMVDEASRACDFLARAAGSRVELVARDDVPPLPVDRKRIVQVLQNVLENALRHAPSDSEVTVELARLDGDGSLVRIAVRDRGPGFAIPDLPHVFEPFFTRRQGGTGLGLSIVQQIVEQHGGRVEARNHPAGGAEVVILLPAAEV
jgi:signal transduction histidine kinase